MLSAVVLFIILFTLMFMGLPVAIALGVSTVITSFLLTDIDMVMIPHRIYSSLDQYSLMAIPMFILAGKMLGTGTSSKRVIEFAKSIVGHLPGGLPISAIFASMIFAAVSGSSPATVIAIGSVMYGAIKAAGYPSSLAIGTIATSGSLGILIPPSLVFILYGVSAQQSIGKLFIAGVVPGIMIGCMLMFVAYISAKRLGFKATTPATWKHRLTTFKDAFWVLLLIVFIIGGIYGGIFTPTEAAGMSVVYAFVISFFIYKDMTMKQLYQVCWDSALTSGMIMFLIANAYVFARFLTVENIPSGLTELIEQMNVGKIGFLIMVNILLIVLGQFMEASSIVMITTPLLLPIAMKLGVDPIHLGVIMVVNMEIGMITPPVGLNLFTASVVSGLSLKEVVIASIPYVLTIFVGLIFITYIPEISLWLPNLLYGK